VQSVDKRESVFLVRTTDGDYEAKNVVIASGLYQSPKIPVFAAAIPADIFQLHSTQYRNPSVPPGARFW
jgi:putative flavoprotein involved in K+ transport